MKNERIVVALGGNALGNNPQEQLALVKETAKSIVALAENGYEVESSAGAALSDQVQNLLVQIMADKELTNDTYKVVVKRIVDRQEELASGAVQ